MKKNIVLSVLCASMLLSGTPAIFADHHQEVKELKAKNAAYEKEIKELKEKEEVKGWGYWAGVGTGAVGTVTAFLGILYIAKKFASDSNNTNNKKKN